MRPAGQAEELTFRIHTSDYVNDDAVITLMPENYAYDTYMFHIGSHNNTAIVLMREDEQVYKLDAAQGAHILDGYTPFWISWSSAESWISLGNGSMVGQNTLFIYYSDHPVSVVGHMLSANGTGTAYICILLCSS